MSQIFSPVRVGRYDLPNRIVMAPMTRSRAQFDGTPGDIGTQYYAQRASVGLIVAEGTQPSDDGQGYPSTPGIYTPAHVAGWQKITSAVHGKGSRIFIQLMHAGRLSHPDNTPHHRQGVAPSAIAPGTGMFTPSGMQDGEASPTRAFPAVPVAIGGNHAPVTWLLPSRQKPSGNSFSRQFRARCD